MTTYGDLDVRPISGALGAEIGNVDVSSDLDDATIADIRAAFLDHHVLVFRDQHVMPEQQMAFARRFGDLDIHPFVDGDPDHPEVIDIITRPDDRMNFGGGWHSDLTFLEAPDLGSVLYAVELPEVGGDTLFADQHAAYDELSDTMKGVLDGLSAVHSAAPQYGDGGLSTRSAAMATKNPDASHATLEHPLVRTHPETGRKALFVNGGFTVGIAGMRRSEARPILDFLLRHAVKERFTCRVAWELGTLAMWDNRSVQHYALHDYAGQRRHMRRVTIKGDRPR
jgi:taurine dioxygenase